MKLEYQIPQTLDASFDSANVDELLEEGFACPNCGSREFVTRQLVNVPQRIRNGEWEAWDPEEADNGMTVSVSCEKCEAILWENDYAEI